MVEDAIKVGKLFAHRMEADEKFGEIEIDLLLSSAAKEPFVPSAAIGSLVVERL